MSKEKQPKPEPNVIFAGKSERLNKETGKPEKVLREAPAFIIDGREKITLPENLEKGAFVEDAERLKALFPSDFKTPVKK